MTGTPVNRAPPKTRLLAVTAGRRRRLGGARQPSRDRDEDNAPTSFNHARSGVLASEGNI